MVEYCKLPVKSEKMKRKQRQSKKAKRVQKNSGHSRDPEYNGGKRTQKHNWLKSEDTRRSREIDDYLRSNWFLITANWEKSKMAFESLSHRERRVFDLIAIPFIIAEKIKKWGPWVILAILLLVGSYILGRMSWNSPSNSQIRMVSTIM